MHILSNCNFVNFSVNAEDINCYNQLKEDIMLIPIILKGNNIIYTSFPTVFNSVRSSMLIHLALMHVVHIQSWSVDYYFFQCISLYKQYFPKLIKQNKHGTQS